VALSVTYNRVIDVAKSFGTRHAQISEFQVGTDPEDVDWKKATNGVYMLFAITRIVPAINELTYEMAAIFMDVNNKGEELVDYRQQTLTNIHNDTVLIALDFLAFWEGVGIGDSGSNCVSIAENVSLERGSISLEPFEIKGRSGYAGTTLSFTLTAPYDYDRRSIPLDIAEGASVVFNVDFEVYINEVLADSGVFNAKIGQDFTINLEDPSVTVVSTGGSYDESDVAFDVLVDSVIQDAFNLDLTEDQTINIVF
jgi:hypothetical protein